MKTIYEFPVLWEEGDMYNVGKICEDASGERVIVLTDHGREYVGYMCELIDRIEAYLEAAKATTRAIAILRREEGSEEFLSE